MRLLWSLALALEWGSLAQPLPPVQERASFKLADPSLAVELAAAEPDVRSPVAMAFDASGQLFVAEMTGYPVGPGLGSIRLLQDKDADGRFETSILFAENLTFPNGVLPWRDGVLVTCAPDILFLRDTNGDGRADEKKVVLTGFAEGNQQLRANGLYFGNDGWVYGANGRSDGEIHAPGSAKTISLRGHDFRFKPDTGECEALAGRSQFGLGHDDWGNRFLSWNTIPIRHEVIPERFLLRNPRISSSEALVNMLPESDDGRVFPLTPAPQTFNQESTSHFNALGGLTIYRGERLPGSYYGNAFVGETLRNLVHRRIIKPAGATFTAVRGEGNAEFLASTDPWFHPVNFATGPQGSLFIADFYRQWVEHPGYVPEKFRDKFAWSTGNEHGRIWKVVPLGAPRPPRIVDLSKLPGPELAMKLDAANGWVRDTTMRLLFERQDAAAGSTLHKLAQTSKRPDVRVAALHALANQKALDTDLLRFALNDPHPAVRVAAIRLTENRTELHPALLKLTTDPDPAVRLQLALIAGGAEPSLRDRLLLALAKSEPIDHFLAIAIRSSIGLQNSGLLKAVLTAKSFPEGRLELIRSMAEDLASGSVAEDPETFSKTVLDPMARLAICDGFGRPPDQGGADFARQRLERGSAMSTTQSEILLAALARTQSGQFLDYLMPAAKPSMQDAALNVLARAGSPELDHALLKNWRNLPIRARARFLSIASASNTRAGALVDAISEGVVAKNEVNAAARQSLLRSGSAELRNRAAALFEKAESDRQSVVEKFAEAAAMAGSAERGAALFEKTCAQCHTIGRGQKVGPDLAGVNSRGKDALLVDILDPSRQVASDYLAYTATTDSGEEISGTLGSESAEAVTLHRANLPDAVIPRQKLRGLRAENKSLMPDGLEATMTQQDLADVLEFLTRPPAR